MLHYFNDSVINDVSSMSCIIKAIKDFDEFLFEKSGNAVKEICIFCVGRYGLRLYNDFKQRGLLIKYFCDNNSQKIGYIVDNVFCISPQKLKEIKDDFLVIVANLQPQPILEQLENLGFKYITTQQELLQYIVKIPKITDIKKYECLDKIDYNSRQSELIIQAFRTALADMSLFFTNNSKA